MYYSFKLTLMMLAVASVFAGCNSPKKAAEEAGHEETSPDPKASSPHEKFNVTFITGSTRVHSTSAKIVAELKSIAQQRSDIHVNVIDIASFNLPFLHDEIAPARRKQITDPVIIRWAEAVKAPDAFIIVMPEYNASIPGELKNALDLLYPEWYNKPVGFVGHSGGPDGGSSALSHLRDVTLALKMIPVTTVIKIPTSWKAFDANNKLVDTSIGVQLNRMIDELKAAQVH